jgi:hypothetical protein
MSKIIRPPQDGLELSSVRLAYLSAHFPQRPSVSRFRAVALYREHEELPPRRQDPVSIVRRVAEENARELPPWRQEQQRMDRRCYVAAFIFTTLAALMLFLSALA